MRADKFFAAANALPVADAVTLTGGRGLVVVAPHPDDESLGCGGLIAAATLAGTPVRVVVVSDGTGSHPNSRRYRAAALRRLREDETLEAAQALGLPTRCVDFLGLRDTAVPTEGADADRACAAIAAAVAACDAGAVCVTWPFDPHCDHVASAALAERALGGRLDVRLFHYPVWGWSLPADTDVPGPPRGYRVSVGSHRAAKSAAVAAHRSQLTDLIDDDPDGFRLRPEMLAHFAGSFEIFLTAGRPAP